MVKGTKKLRLDEILIEEGLISDEQIKEALSRQRERGGKFGSQLLYNHYIDEAGLVRALSKQFNCDGVVLSKLDVPEIILKFIPRRLAIARKIIPFDYDLDNNVLKIACEDPTDESLINEIGFVARGKEVKFYIAAELALNTAIAKFYMGRDVSMEDDLLLEIPLEDSDSSSKPQETSEEKPVEEIFVPDEAKTVLLVTDDVEAGPLLKSLLEDDSYQVMLTDSADDAIEMITGRTFHTVLIKDTVPGDYLDLIDRLRKVSPSTIVRYYESTSSLLLDDDSLPAEEGLLRKNLELYTYLLHAKDNLPADHTCVMGRYVDMLCQRMELPYKDRLAVVNAAYLHDVARHYYDITDSADREQTSGLTVKLLKSLGYSPVVVEMLRKMYRNLKGKYTQRLPIEVLGANILTIVDTFLVNSSATGRLSLDKLDSAQKKLREQTDSLLLAEVVEAFIGLLKDEILKFHTEQNASQIMVFSRVPQITEMIETRIKNEGFRVLGTESIEKLAELYERSRPDMIILVPDIEVSYLNTFLDELSNRDINFEKTPTFIMKNGVPSPMLISLFELGIEDVITIDGNFELLIAKICRIQSRLRSKAMQQNVLTEHASTTTGSLEDIRLTDLIQGISTGRRTAKLTVTPNQTNAKELTVFFRKGDIVFARQDKLIGEDAVYSGAVWSEGVWTVETVGEQDLPDSNIDRSNETIQINTFRLLDEKPKSDQPV